MKKFKVRSIQCFTSRLQTLWELCRIPRSTRGTKVWFRLYNFYLKKMKFWKYILTIDLWQNFVISRDKWLGSVTMNKCHLGFDNLIKTNLSDKNTGCSGTRIDFGEDGRGIILTTDNKAFLMVCLSKVKTFSFCVLSPHKCFLAFSFNWWSYFLICR